MDGVTKWLKERPTPLLWLFGPPGSGKTTIVETASDAMPVPPAIIRLSAFRPDDALAESGLEADRFTSKFLLRQAADRRLLIVDGLDALQVKSGVRPGEITDCRFRQLFCALGNYAILGAGVVVTSRALPPSLIPSVSITVIDLPESTDSSRPPLPSAGSFAYRLLEHVALGAGAIDATALAAMSGIEERDAATALLEASMAGLLKQVGKESYQMPDHLRALVLHDASRANAVREVAITGLQKAQSDPVRLLDLLVDHGSVEEAIGIYWQSIGNFSRLHSQGLDHLGSQLCRRLNSGLGPEDVSPAMSTSEGAWAVMNDWSQFASSCGDVDLSARAAASAHALQPSNRPPWDAALLATHAGQAYLAAGDLFAAMEWSQRAWDRSRLGMRSTQGFAVREVMDAYDWSAKTIAKIYARTGQPLEISRLIDDLSAIQERGRQSIVEFNASSIVPLPAPNETVTPEQLVDGTLAALLALTERRFGDVQSLADVNAETSAGPELRVLQLRAAIESAAEDQATALLVRLQHSAERNDDCATECELAELAVSMLENAAERLAAADAFIPRAEACGLGLQWRDLQLARASALRQLGRNGQACDVAKAVLAGTETIKGASQAGDSKAAREAADLLNGLGQTLDDGIREQLDRIALPERPSPRKAKPRRPAVTSQRGEAGRQEMHAAAVRALDAFENDGNPFALYFRKFHLDILHGPFELGPKLTENALRDALPPEAEVITLQEYGAVSSYDLGPSRFRREAPALLIDNDQWVDVAGKLIRRADLIVSEPMFLSEAVRIELQMIYDAGRWDRTVLLVPPPDSPFATVDNDPLIQMFPRCVWANTLHEEDFTESPIVADLLARIRAISALPLQERRALRDARAKETAYPIDLLRIAERLESQADLGSVFAHDNPSTRYFAFWQKFRAAGIRGVKFKQGDQSAANRRALARSYLDMSHVMVDHSIEGDKVVLQGDPSEAQLLLGSAFGLLEGVADDSWTKALRSQIEDAWNRMAQLEDALKRAPERFEIRARYGPLTMGK